MWFTDLLEAIHGCQLVVFLCGDWRRISILSLERKDQGMASPAQDGS